MSRHVNLTLDLFPIPDAAGGLQFDARHFSHFSLFDKFDEKTKTSSEFVQEALCEASSSSELH